MSLVRSWPYWRAVLVWTLVGIALGFILGQIKSASAQVGCVPNPNLAGPPSLVDGCAIPSSAINNVFTTPGKAVFGADYSGGAFGTTNILAGNNRALNSIVGETVNTLGAATLAFPTGTTGYGLLPTAANGGFAGNFVFGVYGQADLKVIGGGGAVGAEFTASNFAGTPDINLPPNTNQGTNTNVANGVQVTCNVLGTNDCSLGVYVSNNGGSYSQNSFNTGVFISIFRQYGLFIATQPSGTQTSAVIQNNGNGAPLQLQTTGPVTPNNPMLKAFNSGSSSVASFAILQGGAIFMQPVAAASLPSCSAPSEGELQPVNDASTNTHGATFTGSSTNHIVAYCNSAGNWVVLYP